MVADYEKQLWLNRALEDYLIAGYVLQSGLGFASGCYHMQQCVEKALKAELVATGEDVGRDHKTHNLVRLAAALESKLEGFSLDNEVGEALMRLTSYESPARYPGDVPGEAHFMDSIHTYNLVADAIATADPGFSLPFFDAVKILAARPFEVAPPFGQERDPGISF